MESTAVSCLWGKLRASVKSEHEQPESFVRKKKEKNVEMSKRKRIN